MDYRCQCRRCQSGVLHHEAGRSEETCSQRKKVAFPTGCSPISTTQITSAKLGTGSDGATVSAKLTSCPSSVFRLPYSQIGLALGSFSEGAHVNSLLKFRHQKQYP